MILRRSKANAADYKLQFQSFCGVVPDVIDVIRNDWVSGEATRVDFRSVGEIDFAQLFKALKTGGYLPAAFKPDLPSKDGVKAMLEAFTDKRGAPMRSLRKGERHLDEEEAAE
jgi:hypothetical protein